MTAQSDVQLILKRLEMLEKQNRRIKQVGWVALLLAVAVLTMGQARASRVLEAESFVVKDKSGQTRAELGIVGNKGVGGVALMILDQGGKARASLGFSDPVNLAAPVGNLPGTPSLILYDAVQTPRVYMSSTPQDASMDFYGPNPASHVAISVAKDGPSVQLQDPNGFHATLGQADLMATTTGTTSKTSAASLHLFSKDGKVLWSAP